MAFLAADASRPNPGLQYPENKIKKKKTKPSPKKLNYKGNSHLKRNTADYDHSIKICPTPLGEFPPSPLLSPPYSMAIVMVPGDLSLAEARLHLPELDTCTERSHKSKHLHRTFSINLMGQRAQN